ncbi:MAG: CcdB family protein [Desulfuromonadales bacterium]|nr:CcdB family protein [Desulfuromonadales bacterium]
MAKFDIYRSPSSSAAYLLDLQDELIDMLSTRVVAPLRKTSSNSRFFGRK